MLTDRDSLLRKLHELRSEGILVILQLLLPISLVHHYSLTDLLRIRQKLAETHDRHRQLMRSSQG